MKFDGGKLIKIMDISLMKIFFKKATAYPSKWLGLLVNLNHVFILTSHITTLDISEKVLFVDIQSLWRIISLKISGRRRLVETSLQLTMITSINDII